MRLSKTYTAVKNIINRALYNYIFTPTIWYTRTVGVVDREFHGICWSPELNLFVTVGDNVDGIMTSPDGINWTSRTNPGGSDSYWYTICWSSELGIFIVGGSHSGSTRMMKSYNGIDWVLVTPSVSYWDSWSSICWSSELHCFVAVGDISGDISYSVDGNSWSRTATAYLWQSVCWSPELNLFVAVGYEYLYTSTNGTSWTNRNANFAGFHVDSICWSPELSLFVAVGSDTTLITSSNGIDWTTQTAPAYMWNSVCWSSELGVFVAVASAADTNNTAVSIDGINWTSVEGSDITRINSVCWSPELSMFAACCCPSSGLGKRIMTTKNVY